jgi:chemotaxis protein MotA
MTSALIGLLLAMAVVIGPILITEGNRAIFISVEALIIVMGGTTAIALIAYPFRHVKHLLRVTFIVIKRQVDDGPKIAREVIELAIKTRGDRNLLQNAKENTRDLFLRDGVQLILDKIDEDLETILTDRIRTRQEEDDVIVGMIRKLGNFPPALGLLATVLALVNLLQSMGTAGGMASLGPTMAVGLVGTLYGIVVSNLVFAPIAENLAYKSSLEVRNRQIAMTGLLLLAARKSPIIVQESVNSMLRVELRVDLIGADTEGNS